MNFFVEARYGRSEWYRIRGSYPVRLAFLLARDYIKEGFEARVLDHEGEQLFPPPDAGYRYPKSPGAGLADGLTATEASTEVHP